MIYVERDQIDEAGTPIRPSAEWFDRAAEATVTAVAAEGMHEPIKALYAHEEVRKALERLFHSNCSYCGDNITAGYDWEVEHFRPKGRVAEREDHLGYYWLAYEWENLYLSCTHCNQRRKDRPSWGDSTLHPSGGKADQFPLLDERTRAMGVEDDVKEEHTLLIDPCYDDPAYYLAYDPTGQIFSLGDNPFGEATIDILHLSRRRLVETRRKTIALVTSLLKIIASNDVPVAARNDLETLLEQQQSADCAFAGVAQYVAKHPTEFGV